MAFAKAVQYRHVFEHFGVADTDRDEFSCYAHAPVFPALVAGQKAAIKRTQRTPGFAEALGDWLRALRAGGVEVVAPVATPMANPARLGEDAWVAYPWIDGRPYDGSVSDIMAAGDLLGRMHAAGYDGAGMARFSWPEYSDEEVEQAAAELTASLCTGGIAAAGDPVPGRLARLLTGFRAWTLPAVREAELPCAPVSLDLRAINLLYRDGVPTLVDPDNAEYAPRLLDLALAALLFHNEIENGPGRLFDDAEWSAFIGAYLRHVQLTRAERALWPTAVRYMLIEWGFWTLTDAAGIGAWAKPAQRSFLRDLANTDEARFLLPAPAPAPAPADSNPVVTS
jgi:Ser/Thr protein kinase RdoA (MazF antagonist)